MYNIFIRKYFYPLVCDFTCYKNIFVKDPLTVARRVAGRILTHLDELQNKKGDAFGKNLYNISQILSEGALLGYYKKY